MVTFEISGTGDRFWNKNSFVKFLAANQKKDLIAMYWDMKYVLDHNYNLLTSKKFQTKITAL